MSSYTAPDWPEADEAILRTLWVQGLSAGEIAKRLPHRTRSAIIGKAHRLKLPGRPSPLGKGRPASAVKPVRAPRPPKQRKAATAQPFDLSKSKTDSTAEQRAEKAAAGRLIIKRTIDAANDNSVPMVGRSFGQCAWPVGTPARAADQLACGAPIYQGIEKCSYCLDHAQRAFARDIILPKPKENLERANRRWAA